MDIGIARQEHASAILKLLKQMHDEAPIDLGRVNELRSMQWIASTIGEPDKPDCPFRAWIAVKDGQLAGTIGIRPSGTWWSDEVFLTDAWFYVGQAYRGSRAAPLLLRALKTHGHKLDMRLKLAVFNGADVDRKDRFYARNGLKIVGGIYLSED